MGVFLLLKIAVFFFRSLLTAERIQQQLIDSMKDVEQALTEGRGEVALSPDVHSMRRKERVLRALCSGCFLNAGKLHISMSSKSKEPLVKGWTSVREGIVLKPSAQSILTAFIPYFRPPKFEQETFSRDVPPTWIIYDQITAIGGYTHFVLESISAESLAR